MRLRQFALGITLAVFGLRCSSEEPPRAPDNIVENEPGALVITSPARGAFLVDDGKAVEVRGTGATPGITVNGAAAEVAPDGSFRTTVKPSPGLNLVIA